MKYLGGMSVLTRAFTIIDEQCKCNCAPIIKKHVLYEAQKHDISEVTLAMIASWVDDYVEFGMDISYALRTADHIRVTARTQARLAIHDRLKKGIIEAYNMTLDARSK